MIPNLKTKLAQISQEQVKEPQYQQSEKLDPECSYHCHEYTKDDSVGDQTLAAFYDLDANILQKVCRVEGGESLLLEDILFFDTETTGLSGSVGTVAFLIGTGRVVDGKLKIEQFLMNDYHQECDMLTRLFDLLSSCKAVASYNGKSFDAPIVSSRSIINRIRQPLDKMMHLDLLYPTRRLYKRRLGSCRLSNIEEQVMGLEREDDIPGAEIPDIFFRYVKYGDGEMLQKVLEHNQQDILSLCALSGVLDNAYRKPLQLGDEQDVLSQGVILEQDREWERALQCYEAASEIMREAKLRQGLLNKRLGRWKEAAVAFEEISQETVMGCLAEIELAKIYEHQIKDLKKALAMTEKAMEKCIGLPDIQRMQLLPELNKRRQRIINKRNNKRRDI